MAELKSIQELPAKSWEEARSILLSVASEGVLFRGQAKEDWYLTSSIARLIDELYNSPTAMDASLLEEALMEEFFKAYRRLPSEPVSSREELLAEFVNVFQTTQESYHELNKARNELIAFAQHYTLPTRFLDWSHSPYIATFFAFDGHKTSALFGPDDRIAVWALDRRRLELLKYCVYTDKSLPAGVTDYPEDFEGVSQLIRVDNQPRIEVIEIIGNPNRRLIFQEGLFTCVFNTVDDIEVYLREYDQYASGIVLTKVVIPADLRREVLKDLSMMAINAVTLMNDPEGAAATAFNKVVRFDVTARPSTPEENGEASTA